jgi:hypothetical protein
MRLRDFMAKLGWSCLLGLSLALMAGDANLARRRELLASGVPRAAAEDSSGGSWAGFPPYPHARFLCDQYILGKDSNSKRVSINWSSFATRDATEKVIAFYSKPENGKVEKDGESVTIHRDDSRSLSVYPASAGGYPTCEKKSEPEEKTVIIVSTRSGP